MRRAPLISPVRLLGADRQRVENGMGVVHAGEHQLGVDGVVLVEGHEHRRRRGDALERVQVVRQRRLIGVGMEPVVVPAGPGPPVARQQPGVGVQGGPVGLVADGTENWLAPPGRDPTSRRSAWSLWVATTTWSNGSTPPAPTSSTPPGLLRILSMGVPSRTRPSACKGRRMACT